MPLNPALLLIYNHPSSLLLGKGFSSDITGDGPFPSYKPDRAWEPIHFNFQLIYARQASLLVRQFGSDSLYAFFPERGMTNS
jgi:hypothetical protein